jgi:O-antigen/teichoic acid export membrane protein
MSEPGGGLAAPRFAAPLAIGEQALFALANLALQILLARAVSQRDFGAYTVASTFLFIAAVAHQTCLVEPMVVLGAGRLRGAIAPYHARLLGGWSVVASLGVAGAGMGLAGIAALLGWGAIAVALAAFAAAAPVILYLWLLRRIAFALGRIDLSAAATALYAGTTGALAVAALALGLFGTGTAILATGVAAALACVFLRARLRWPPATEAPPPRLWALHLAYGRWALGAEVVAWALANAPILAAPAWLGLAAAAELRALGLLFMPLLQVASVASLLLLRRFAGTGGVDRATQTRAFLLLGGGGALYALGVVALGPALIPRVFGVEYRLDAAVLATAGFGATCLVAAQAFVVALRAAERTRPVLFANLAALSLLVLLAPGAARHDLLGITTAQAAAAAAALLVAALLAAPRAAVPRRA